MIFIILFLRQFLHTDNRDMYIVYHCIVPESELLDDECKVEILQWDRWGGVW